MVKKEQSILKTIGKSFLFLFASYVWNRPVSHVSKVKNYNVRLILKKKKTGNYFHSIWIVFRAVYDDVNTVKILCVMFHSFFVPFWAISIVLHLWKYLLAPLRVFLAFSVVVW